MTEFIRRTLGGDSLYSWDINFVTHSAVNIDFDVCPLWTIQAGHPRKYLVLQVIYYYFSLSNQKVSLETRQLRYNDVWSFRVLIDLSAL